MTDPQSNHRDLSNDSAFDRSSDEPSESLESRDEILDSMLERTRHFLDDKSYHGVLTDYVREQRLPSKFDFENLSELVRCVLSKRSLEQLPISQEECISWITTCIYEDPVANERAATLWNSIVTRIQDHQ